MGSKRELASCVSFYSSCLGVGSVEARGMFGDVHEADLSSLPRTAFPCQMTGCTKSFSRKDNLQQHVRQMPVSSFARLG